VGQGRAGPRHQAGAGSDRRSVFIYRPGEDNNPDQTPTPDALLMADSWVHTTFVGTRLTRVRGLTVTNNGQWLLNRQLDLDGRMQTLTLVNKADYTWKRGRLTVQPMVKHLYKKLTAAAGAGRWSRGTSSPRSCDSTCG